jgi:hypothetical protein
MFVEAIVCPRTVEAARYLSIDAAVSPQQPCGRRVCSTVEVVARLVTLPDKCPFLRSGTDSLGQQFPRGRSVLIDPSHPCYSHTSLLSLSAFRLAEWERRGRKQSPDCHPRGLLEVPHRCGSVQHA